MGNETTALCTSCWVPITEHASMRELCDRITRAAVVLDTIIDNADHNDPSAVSLARLVKDLLNVQRSSLVASLFAEIERSRAERTELRTRLRDFGRALSEQQKPLPAYITKAINEHFWELFEEEGA